MRLHLPLLVLAILSCRPTGAVLSPVDFRRSLSGGDWELVELRGQAAAVGAGGRRATLVFDADSARVSGFAGCNRYFSTYTLDDDDPELRFGPIGMTRMACSEGMDLERQPGEALSQTTRYRVEDTRLILSDASSPVAVFARGAR
ncbi:MAG TPA: META domain-containing protein [Gemmatimonadaceae bacterium]|nr:META domain-containing protein [Gemmatimonadaceae bacterium]